MSNQKADAVITGAEVAAVADMYRSRYKDAERAAFEAWYESQYPFATCRPKWANGKYKHPHIDDMWLGWQARAKQNVSYF